MNHELDVIELEPNDLQQVPGVVRSNCKDFRRVGVGFEVDDGEGMVDGLKDGGVVDAVLAGGTMDFRIIIS